MMTMEAQEQNEKKRKEIPRWVMDAKNLGKAIQQEAENLESEQRREKNAKVDQNA